MTGHTPQLLVTLSPSGSLQVELPAAGGTLAAAQEAQDENHVVPYRNVIEYEPDLVQMNDKYHKTFPEIADFVEETILPLAPDEMVLDALTPGKCAHD